MSDGSPAHRRRRRNDLSSAAAHSDHLPLKLVAHACKIVEFCGSAQVALFALLDNGLG
jgi:hypothetical protein